LTRLAILGTGLDSGRCDMVTKKERLERLGSCGFSMA
jgi:hypothetical protein